MTSFERASGDPIDRRPPPELAFWACLAMMTAMGVVGLIIGIAFSFWREPSDDTAWGETVLAILILSAPVLMPAAMLYRSVFCRSRLAAAAMTVCLCIVSIGAFFGMLAATFYSEAATATLLVVFGIALRVGHLNSCWYSVLEQDDVAPQSQFRRLDLGLALLSVVLMMTVAAWTWTR
ncbi:hypothetical protein M4951_00220 [Blastopirellula sp. J2-11]|uniref:hypothetical protein n=1 Tax=Blastopirellula sp. J2-11 TaxID=2943192 RepID=UPI0021CA8AB6|nr:hypothetical protein [Blastopirellula sp. J2-11]UUO06754.1 hypothetical protein M4951_00220 [Blastopirellula sp. J2-11]